MHRILDSGSQPWLDISIDVTVSTAAGIGNSAEQCSLNTFPFDQALRETHRWRDGGKIVIGRTEAREG
jgi:hypothetical protein